MKIAFDLRRIGNPGIGRYMKCLVEAILQQDADNEYLLLLPPESTNVFTLNCGNATRLFPRSRYYSIREQIELPRILRQHKVDLLHSPHFLLPLSRPCPAVVTIHDVIYLACPQDLKSPLGRAYYGAMMRASARAAKRIITDSAFSKNEITRLLNVDPEKIAVIYPAVDPCFAPVSDSRVLDSVLSKHRIDCEYIFYTGIYKPRKNHDGLLKAFQHFLSGTRKPKLVIAGPLGEGEAQLRRSAQELGISEHLVLTGFIDDSELRALYSAARVYACPSLYEGFGFTVLEAMACGVPVVCSRETSLPEVGGDAALYADARDPGHFAEALYRAFTDEDLRQNLLARTPGNLQRFNWSHAALRCLEAYDNALGTFNCQPAAVA